MRDEPAPPPSNRARGAIEAAFRRAGARTEVVGPRETGGYRLRLPRGRGGPREAVIVNTGGGMAGGDRLSLRFAAERGAAAVLTTTAAEKVYRGAEAGGAEAETRVDLALEVAEGASLDWLPQETILFDGARLSRRLDAAVAPGGALLVCETLVFGRLAMGERVASGRLNDRWRVRRGGRLLMAEELRLEGDAAGLLDRPALGGGARAAATVALVAPDAEARLDAARAALDGTGATAGVSAWDGLLVARALSPSPERLRAAIVALLSGLRGRPPPRLWG